MSLSVVAGQGGHGTKDFKPSGLKWEEILPGNYDGAAHLKDQALDGVEASVLFPAVTIQAYVEKDREYAMAVLRCYNDWLIEDFCAADPGRLAGLCMLPVDDGVDVTLRELERCLAKGAKGCFIPGLPRRAYYAAMKSDSQMQDMCMYSTDYPHSVSLWPNSRRLIAELTKRYDENAKHEVLAGNAARAFGLG